MTALLNLYWLAAATLLAAILGFRVVEGLVRNLSGRLTSLQWLRIGQTALLTSLLMGVVIPLLPLRAGVAPASGVPGVAGWDGDRETPLVNHPAEPLKRESRAFVQRAAQTARRRAPMALLLLLLGASFAVIRTSLHLHRLKRCLRAAVPWRRLGKVRLLVSDECAIPFAARGLEHAYIVLPVGLLSSRRDLLIAIRHELQHHRQGDTVWVFLMETLRVSFFWNPAVYLWERRLSELQELACDEAVVTLRKVRAYDYGDCLLRVAEAHRAQSERFLATAGMSCGGSGPGSLLKRRLQMLSETSRQSSNLKLGVVIAMNVAALVAVTAYAGTWFGRPSFAGSARALSHPLGHPGVQRIVERTLAEAVTRAGAVAAFAVVSDPQTGDILASAHVRKGVDGVPIADSSQSDFLAHPFLPYSVAKPLVTALAIDKGKTSADEIQDAENGVYELDGITYRDWNAFGKISTADVLVHSSNIGAIKIGEKVGGTQLTSGLRSLGFGPGGSSSVFPGAAPGAVPTATGVSDVTLAADYSEGAGFTVTPLEVTQAYGALVNGGRLLRPRDYAARSGKPAIVRQVISTVSSATMRSILQRVVTDGTGRRATTSDYTTGGKTGTGWEMNVTSRKHQNARASFAGFAPVEAPRLVAYVVVIDPADPHPTGGDYAAPVFARIAERTLHALGVAPDKHE